jgi:hypothetical protein
LKKLISKPACFIFSLFNGGDRSHANAPRHYIPSPLGSPAAARRLGQRLGDKICSSPILTRVKKKWKDGEDQVLKSCLKFRKPDQTFFSSQRKTTFCGLLGGQGGDDEDDEELNLYLWRQKGDAGRIAHRYAEDKWDAW